MVLIYNWYDTTKHITAVCRFLTNDASYVRVLPCQTCSSKIHSLRSYDLYLVGNVFDKMEPHNLIIMWLGLVLGLVVIPIIVFVILKWRRAEAQKKDKKKTTFCKWFFKCDQGQNRNNKNEEHEMNGDAPTDRLI